MMRTTPRRRTTLHLSHIRFTDALTFMFSPSRFAHPDQSDSHDPRRTMRPRVTSRALTSTLTVSPTTSRTKLRPRPDGACATNSPPPATVTRYNARGRIAVTVPVTVLRPAPATALGALSRQGRSRPRGQHQRPGGGHCHRVLKVRRQAAVPRNRRPLVGQDPRLRPAGCHHRLDRQDHPSRQLRPPTARSVVRDLRLLVQLLADAVSHELAHHRKSVRFHPGLYRVPDVRQPPADPNLRDGPLERLTRHPQ